MAKFKRGNLDLNTNQKIRLGNSLESFFQFDGSNLIVSNPDGDIQINGNLTLDATSDIVCNNIYASGLTIGNTVITDGTIDSPGASFFNSASEFYSGLNVGISDTQAGSINLYGHSSGGGGGLNLWLPDDSNADILAYQFGITEDDFSIGPNTDPDAFQFIGNVAAVTAKFNVDLDINAALTVSGVPIVPTNVTTQTSDYTAVDGDVVLANSTDSTSLITLTTQNHAEITIKYISDSTATDVIIQADSGQIENLNSITLENQYEYIKVVCDGTDWWITSSNPIDRSDL